MTSVSKAPLFDPARVAVYDAMRAVMKADAARQEHPGLLTTAEFWERSIRAADEALSAYVADRMAGRLDAVLNDIRSVLATDDRDRQMALERAEARLTEILSDLTRGERT